MSQTRILSLDGGHNVRDLGGLGTADGRHIKPGMLYRAGELSRLSDRDLKELEDRSLKTIIDFRDVQERNVWPDRIPASVNNIRHIPIVAGDILALDQLTDENGFSVMQKLYAALAGAQKEYREFFRIVQETDSAPLLFHCSVGKDRTGFAAFLLLNALGVHEDEILRDYLLTNDHIAPQFKAFAQSDPKFTPLVVAAPEYLAAARRAMGSSDNFGIDRQKLRSLYLA